jgi:REP element-mobilizing transposase RayT
MPIAYHIIWTTYGTWLPGDQRGWHEKGDWIVQAADAERERQARESMKGSAVALNEEQRSIVQQTIIEHCRIRGWTLHAANARSNHVHVVVSAESKPEEIRNQLKAWCSRRLSDHSRLSQKVAKSAGRRRWFTEGGDIEFIDDDEQLQEAATYVAERQEP